MHIPSERVYNEMRSEHASLWFVPAIGGDEMAMLLKAPTTSIKALIAGCPLHLLFGKSGNYLCNAAQIHDTPDAPLAISGVQRVAEEHETLQRILEMRSFPVFLFNEMDVCLAWTNASLTHEDATEASEYIGPASKLYVGEFGAEASHALDCFDYSVDGTRNLPGAKRIEIEDVTVALEGWRTVEASFVGVHEHYSVVVDDKDEGEMLERAVWASLESVFPLTLHKSPQVKTGEKERELTDVLAFYHYGSFLIEAKDLSVFQADPSRNQHRRIGGVQKQVKKAVRQLVGAVKALKRGDLVFDKEQGRELVFDRQQPPHCIVLISELMHAGDWSDVERELLEAMKTTGGFFHLLDLRELIMLLKASSGKAELVDYNLIERFKHFVEKRTVHIRAQPRGNTRN